MTYVRCAIFFCIFSVTEQRTKGLFSVNPDYEFHVQFIREVEKIYHESFTTLGIIFKASMAL